MVDRMDGSEFSARGSRGQKVSALARRLAAVIEIADDLTPAQRARIRPALVAAVAAISDEVDR
jgi:hypothetical protein